MFSKLRNKFVLITMGVATVILLVAFTAIFAITAANMRKPRPMAIVFEGLSESATLELEEMMGERLEEANAEHLARLALVLICVGAAVEIVVFMASYHLAENAIRPVKETYKQQREFIANASHELKTPLAIIQANFEALEIEEEPWAGNINAELGRANQLVGDLLLLARAEEQIGEIKKRRFDVVSTIHKLGTAFEPRLNGRTMTVEGEESLIMELNERDFEQIMSIFLDNAMKYAKSYVKITVQEKFVEVSNDGKTISKEKLNKIFERFYQVDKTSEGSGLGLAIAKAIAQRNHWGLLAQSNGGVTSFRVVW